MHIEERLEFVDSLPALPAVIKPRAFSLNTPDTPIDPDKESGTVGPEMMNIYMPGVSEQNREDVDNCKLLVQNAAIHKAQSENKKVKVAYLNDKTLGIKLFADKAFYAVNAGDPRKPQIVPFLLKKDAQAEAAAIGGKLATYPEALAAAGL